MIRGCPNRTTSPSTAPTASVSTPRSPPPAPGSPRPARRPPTALLVRALERCAPQPDTQIGRITVEVLGPIPAGEVSVHAAVEPPGRSVELLAAEITAAGRAVLRARAWRLAVGDTAAVATGQDDGAPAPPRPPPRPSPHRAPPGWLPGFIDALEWRWLRGWLGEPGPGTAWARQRVPLVAGEEPSPLQRLTPGRLGTGPPPRSTSANGSSSTPSSPSTCTARRRGTWMAVDAQTIVGPSGLGTVAGPAVRPHGHVGRSAQRLTVRRRT